MFIARWRRFRLEQTFGEVDNVRTVAQTWIPMADERLSAKLWLPDPLPEGGVPAILEYAPYRKDDATAAGDEHMSAGSRPAATPASVSTSGLRRL